MRDLSIPEESLFWAACDPSALNNNHPSQSRSLYWLLNSTFLDCGRMFSTFLPCGHLSVFASALHGSSLGPRAPSPALPSTAGHCSSCSSLLQFLHRGLRISHTDFWLSFSQLKTWILVSHLLLTKQVCLVILVSSLGHSSAIKYYLTSDL